ncbi:DUF4956 domain-containing protein [Sporosarcina sp. BI001-red]|uniref:DUF4956 domain-containing protein n=1 Tax=Sporosarcina sp. BI001-red TaxID=2282866 RepID=UPI001F2F53BD|nr:DUF4956 domain-containing protein [Sporosarcina sp. BI001-red]
MVLAAILSLVINKVYQVTFTGERYAQAFVHTIIMMSVVVSLVMNVVSGNAGVAFDVFAVFSLIRFRSDVTNAKDIALKIQIAPYSIYFIIIGTFLMDRYFLHETKKR